jgi:isoamylase
MLTRLPEQLLPLPLAPLGAHVCQGGVSFAVFSEHATQIELCIFNADGEQELKRFTLHGPDDAIFHGVLALDNLPEGNLALVYGFRAHGPYAPQAGQRFNAHKLLLDPYAREIIGRFSWDGAHHSYLPGHPEGLRALDERDNARSALKARVALASVTPPQWIRPQIAAHHLVLYEVHVKGFSQLNNEIPAELRGTFAALAHPAAIAHFLRLGVTTLSLLPIHYCLTEPHLARMKLPNYWGYNTIGFFCPDPRLSTQTDPSLIRAEFKAMTAKLHAAGLEVVLDVVLNHSAEGNELGPNISFRGLDNTSYYRAAKEDLARTENFSGCGNTLKIAHPRVTQWALDALRYWVTEMGVDGFRFDLASVLGRGRVDERFDASAAFFVALRQDPVLAGVRLIAEPWDCGPNGYQLGHYPGRFLEWNDRYRDAMRRYWLGKSIARGEFARRFCGSSDIFHHAGKSPLASINFIAAHDGFTTADIVSYSHKHNLANGEGNRDGRSDELCHGFGAEGETAEPAIIETRTRVRHALLASLLLSQGTPMLLAGDEIAHSQSGNNNAYCQDNAISWLNWQRANAQTSRLVATLIQLRQRFALLHHRDWFASEIAQTAQARVLWLAPAGHVMQVSDWHDTQELALACEFYAPMQTVPALRLLFNPEPRETHFRLSQHRWRVLFNSAQPDAAAQIPEHHINAPATSVLLLETFL